MDTWEAKRRKMVKDQIKDRGIKDKKVIEAMLKVPRHLFVPFESDLQSYEDKPLPIGEGQTISQPYMVSLMTECLTIKSDDKVLEIGTGSGYQTAILAELASMVYSIERFENLARKARKILTGLGYTNVEIIVGDGTLGFEESAPYDRILVTAGSPQIPATLIHQLKEGGRLVVPVGSRYSQILYRITKVKGKVEKETFSPCLFVPLIGKYGWQREEETYH